MTPALPPVAPRSISAELYAPAMPPAPEGQGAPALTRRRKRLPVVGAAIALAAAAALTAAITARVAGTESAQQTVGVHSSGPVATNDWRLADRATLQSESGHTRLLVRLIRTTAAPLTPALTSDFDGSGGGEAKRITCTADAQRWSVAIGRAQSVTLECSAYVDAHALHSLAYVHLGRA